MHHYGILRSLELKFNFDVSGQFIGIIFNTPTIQIDLTSRSLLDVYIGIVKCYPLCCNYIKGLLIKIQTVFPIYIKSTSRNITQNIITLTVNIFHRLPQSGQ
jgi:hypothetical protein